MDWIAVFSRWTHVATAIVIVGGTFFLRFMMSPALETLGDAARAEFTQRVLKAWRKVVNTGMLLFIVSGLYNYLVVAVPSHKGVKLYHPLIGTKILLAFVMFYIASALVGKSTRFEAMRKNAKFWQSIILLIAVLIVGISGYAKVVLKGSNPTASNVLPAK